MAATSAFVFTHARRESEAEKLLALRKALLARGRARSQGAGLALRDASLVDNAAVMGWRGGRRRAAPAQQ